jgi:hypothetical protein
MEFVLSERQINFVAKVLREEIETKRTLNEGDLRYYNELSNRALVEKFFSYDAGINLNEGIGEFIEGIVDKIVDAVSSGIEAIKNAISSLIPNKNDGVYDKLKDKAGDTVDNIKNKTKDIVDKAGDVIDKAKGESLFSKIKDQISGLFQAFNGAVVSGITTILTFVGVDAVTAKSIAGAIGPYITGAITLLTVVLVYKLIKLTIKFVKSLASKAKRGKESKDQVESEAKKAASISLSMQKQIASKIKDREKKAKAMQQINAKEQKLKAALAKK